MKKLNKKKKGQTKPKINEGSYSFVVGNGTSRKDFDLKGIKDYGTLIACNWFFREEFAPDILVCSDEPITRTLLKVYPHYPKTKWFYTWFPKPGSGAKKPNTPEKFSAGGLSTFIACDVVKSKKVFLIGMDFFGFGSKGKDNNGKLNNLYMNKKHYLKSEGDKNPPAPTYRNWQRRFQWIVQNFPDVDFYHVDPFEGRSPERLIGFDNFHQISWDNLNDHIHNDAELIDMKEIGQEDIELAHAFNPDNERAAIERQLVGQENRVMPDLLNRHQILELRLKGAEYLRKNGMGKGYPMIRIGNHDVMLPMNTIKEGNIDRAPTDKEVRAMWEREYAQRYTGPNASLKMKKPKGVQPRSFATPPPPPPIQSPTDFKVPPPPPPPPI